MLNRLYLWLRHWSMNTLPKPDDHHVKCATCGREYVWLSSLRYVNTYGNNYEAVCDMCLGNHLYYKKDWLNFKASPINIKFKIDRKDFDNE